MAQKQLTPPASALMQSIRGVGYDAKTAVADLIDNSIAAGASTVWLEFRWDGRDSTVTLLDDGRGMAPEELDRAMTLGSRSPLEQRAASDLGRFGLGLKTASLSQCARLLVASKAAQCDVHTRVWDLALVHRTDQWLVEDRSEGSEGELLRPLDAMNSGTVVVWRLLDRLVGDVCTDDSRARLDFQRTSREVEAHLGMVFHRFIEGMRPKLRIYVNGETEEFRVKGWDPFLTAHPSTQQMPEVRRGSSAGTVVLQGFVLPHKDRFDGDEYEVAAGPAGWTSQEGFYVYRGQRLLVSGSWLGLGKPKRWIRDEQHKLARIRLDLPNTLDAAWNIDVKKSAALPPLELRDWLTRNAEGIRSAAREVYVHRGSPLPPGRRAAFSPAWLSGAGNSPAYLINREHPVVAELLRTTPAQRAIVERAFRLLETTVPVHRIWLDVSERPEAPASTSEQLDAETVEKLAKDLLSRLEAGQKMSRANALEVLRLTEPFDQFPAILASLAS
ncbi:MAG: ATP-binding protein [Gemmatimonadaceae bacterium]|nr:ATP-binding protein [Gemmatimonadaceae bacterium]